MKKLFDNLKNLMNKYDLYQSDDEVGLVLNELEIAVNTEIRVYVLDLNHPRLDDIDDVHGLTNEEFMSESEEQGRVYTLNGFAQAFNCESINSNTDVIRFIEVPVSL
jgi:hypothetical protein